MDYPFIKCLFPRVVANRYTGDTLQCSCGHCIACLMSKFQHHSLLTQMESSNNMFTLFVTLTYSNNYIPRVRLKYHAGHCKFYYRNYCSRLGSLGSVIGSHSCRVTDPEYLTFRKLQSRANLDGDFGRVSVRDFQLFLKRIRKYVFTETGQKIRYYGVSEYGPRTFRPHYHFLFFCKSKPALSSLQQNLSKAWRYGRINSSVSEGFSNSYVASYVNSVVSLPTLFKVSSLCTFSHHSNFLGQELCKLPAEEVYSHEFDEFVKRSIVLGDKVMEYSPSRSLISYYFPKCIGFANKSARELCQSYTIYHASVSRYGERPCKELARLIYNDNSSNPVTDYFSLERSEPLKPIRIHGEVIDVDYSTRILRHLYISKHFIDFCCDGYLERCNNVISVIKRFYSYLSLSQLSSFYQSQVDFLSAYPVSGLDFLNNFYFNLYDDYSSELYFHSFSDPSVISMPSSYNSIYNHSSFRSYFFHLHDMFNRSVKHKELNDKNDIFNNIKYGKYNEFEGFEE